MRSNRLGCLTGTGIFAALITAFAIAGYSYASGGQMFSPGPLNAVPGAMLGNVTSHADIAGACSACHVAPWETQTMNDRCVVCHTDVPAQMLDVLTPHGRMFAIDSTAQCRDCHPEHRGSNAMLTEIEGWKYPHELSGYSLAAHQFKSKNDAFKCADCHRNDVTAFDVNTCATCHEEIDSGFTKIHIIAYGNSCLDCHDGVDRFGKNFSHENFVFKLTGKHTRVICENCHVGARGLADFAVTPQDCASCHTKNDPHGGELGPDCAACHTTEGWKPSTFDHNKSEFKLADAHINVTCEKCHINNVFKGTPKDCFSCHKQDDPHGGALGTDCASCHKATTWKETTFDHSKSAFLLTGKHSSVKCADCHKDNVFKGTSKDCASCHVDFHNGQLGNDCASCHSSTDWKDLHFDHNKSKFPLTGKHTSAQCTACHANNVFKGTPTNCFTCHASKDVHGGQFGSDCGKCHNPSDWKNVSFNHNNTNFPLTGGHTSVLCKSCHTNGVFKGTPKDCYACHASSDTHTGQLGKVCSTCHNTSGWKNVTFNHGNTAFPLAGSHATVACKSCHINNIYKGTSKDCYSCHAAKDQHNGQLGTNCASCHKPTKWSDVVFDHSKTAFPLAGTHTTVVCKSCHINGVYKGTPKDCYSCHAAKDAHNSQFGTNCGACHKPTKWSDVTFDHNTTAFPLSGTHTTVACKSCHANGVYKGTPKDCYSCHAAKDKHNGQFGTNCGSCHKPTKWSDVTFNHNNTAFPLTGKHTGLTCQSCHANGVYKGTPKDCYSCHAAKDAHNGQFGTNCGTCHNPNGWGNASFNHNNTAFPLVGHHTGLECKKCHGNGVYKGTPTACIACHADKDKHQGANGTDCGICHTPEDWGKIK